MTFEGGEGGGKTTQLRCLAERLSEAGIAVTTTREPGGTPKAEAIRRVLLSGAARPLGPEAEAVLFAAARLDHVEQLVAPALAAGSWVLSDRFIDSTRAYQGAAGVPADLIRVLEDITVRPLWPDLTIILDLPVEEGLRRAAGRSARTDVAPDRFETDAIAEHEARRQTFLAIAAAEPDRCVVIDATQAPDRVAADVWAAVGGRLAPVSPANGR